MCGVLVCYRTSWCVRSRGRRLTSVGRPHTRFGGGKAAEEGCGRLRGTGEYSEEVVGCTRNGSVRMVQRGLRICIIFFFCVLCDYNRYAGVDYLGDAGIDKHGEGIS